MASDKNDESKPATATEGETTQPATNNESSEDAKRPTSWPYVLILLHVHVLGSYGLAVAILKAKLMTTVFGLLLLMLGLLGATCGAHRLWTHKSYTASTGLRVFLMLCQTLVGQGSIYNWVQSHRLHHATLGTADDPYYSARGLFEAQVVTQLQNYSPKQERLLQEVDMTDLEQDRVVMFQKSFYWPMYFVLMLLLPINAPMEYWGEGFINSFFVVGCLRYLLVLHGAWLINSAKHVWGIERGERYPSDSNMIFFITKSYWPSYHYMLPWDYQSGEYGTYGSGCSTAFIRVFAALGLATKLRTMDSASVKRALAQSVDTGKPIEQCLEEAGQRAQETLHPEHYLDAVRYTT